jgi:hypothetical protein
VISTSSTTKRIPIVSAVAACLLALSILGGVLAVAWHVNTATDAFGNQAEMAAPWPMLMLLALGGVVTARWRDWRAVVGTFTIVVPCVAALGSIADNQMFRQGLPAMTYAYQVLILVASAAGLVVCACHLRMLHRTHVITVA